MGIGGCCKGCAVAALRVLDYNPRGLEEGLAGGDWVGVRARQSGCKRVFTAPGPQ